MRTDVAWIGAILLTASLVVSSFVPSMLGYAAILAVYVLFIRALVVTGHFTVVYHWAVVPMVLLIWVMFVLTTALNPTMAGLLRLSAFIVITGINLFIIPAIIDQTILHDVIAYIAGAFVLVGLPTAFIGTYTIAGVMISPWHTDIELLGIMLHVPMSVFDNPNYLASVAAIGAIAAGARYTRSHTPLAAGLVGLNISGVVLANGRAALLALIVAGGLYVVYIRFGPIAMATLVMVGAPATVVGFAMVFDIIPGLSIITATDLNGRQALWTAAYEAILNRPVIGWGPGKDIAVLAKYIEGPVNATHNSYLRMFLISGILGGGAYLILTITTVIIGMRNAQSETIFTFLLLMAFFIIQIFEGMTVFGLSLLSILGALFVGYVQSQGAGRRIVLNIRYSPNELISEIMAKLSSLK